MDLVCPKCQGAMRQYERSGVSVDQCSECRGIFLDRGELERLIDAETAYHTAPPEPARQKARYERRERYDDDDEHHRYGSHGHEPHKRRKGSFLSELFD